MEKIFIGWNKLENRAVANCLKEKLEADGYGVIVGGQREEDKNTVAITVISQMDRCDFAVFIIEGSVVQEEKSKRSKIHFSGNVMFEIGYLCSRFNNKRRMKLFLLGTDPSQLPTDILGAWADRLEKPSASDEEDPQKVNEKLAQKMYEETVEELEQLDPETDKFEYLAKWESNKSLIYRFNGTGDISNILLFGLQTAIYNGETKQLYDKLRQISVTKLPEHLIAAINCAKAILSVFIITDQLMSLPSSGDLRDAIDNLKSPCEEKIKQADLKAWCRILRTDKLELCYENAARVFPAKAERYLRKAEETSAEVIRLVSGQIEANPNDRDFAQIYLSFQYRNMALTLKELRTYRPDEYPEEREYEYRRKTVEVRRELRRFYGEKYRQDDTFYDFLTQEYILALSELYPFMDDEDDREETMEEITEKMSDWQKKIECKNFIFKKISDVVKNLKDGETE